MAGSQQPEEITFQEHVLTERERELSSQIESVEYIDAKAASLFTLITGASGVISLVAVISPYVGLPVPPSQISQADVLEYYEPFLLEPSIFVGIVCLLFSLVFAVVTRDVGDYYDGLKEEHIDAAVADIKAKSISETWRIDVVENLEESVEHNARRIQYKTFTYSVSVYLLMGSILFLFIGLYNIALDTSVLASYVSVVVVGVVIIGIRILSMIRAPTADEHAPQNRGMPNTPIAQVAKAVFRR
ncbi:hypothetical protein [Natrinema caseinilyticum]|uniref:hypothetical protein n=1 Tax=Natrinema caseinilyticum TaxID=2961570 RepID=UPI0020C342E4|nr:hypothetical protein [Natrinema caseinilyticum]